ncbi:VWA domain-containing protein [Kamptonema formosum]|uniref:VWA domain-containing protein n=1 Tax=Kamptonema formosum TaxID=331992 RepID=UPI00034ACC4C|nr:VWA domain-containing protein [Oscillatoria sp. PCC 10802]
MNAMDWDMPPMPEGQRRLPVYLLLDTSGSMEGAPIESVRLGVEQFQSEVAQDDIARDLVHAGIITFADDAELFTGKLQPIRSLRVPELVASGVTRLDRAFQVLRESFDRDLKRTVKGGQKGDYKPVVFVLTDGEPTDEHAYATDRLWKPERDATVNRDKGMVKPSLIVSVGCGPDVRDATLKDISTGTAFRMGTSEAAFVGLFKYLSMSIANSVQAGANPDNPLAGVSIPSGLIPIP